MSTHSDHSPHTSLLRHALATWVAAIALMAAVVLPESADSAVTRDPAFTVPIATLRAAVACDRIVRPGIPHEPVLLVHGTGGTPAEYWSWNWERALPAAGFGFCTVTLPKRATVNLLISAQYVAYAAEYAARLSRRRIAIFGHSQGGTLAVWAAKFWPTVARDTSDVISLDGGFPGSSIASAACALGRCGVLEWQYANGSHFMRAWKRAPLPSGVSFTALWSKTDELFLADPNGAEIPGATNTPIQSICPLHVADHLTVVVDSASYALIMDALTHPGAADPARLHDTASICERLFMPHVDWLKAPQAARTAAAFLLAFASTPVGREPTLPPYAVNYGR